MRSTILIIAVSVTLGGVCVAQDTDYSIFSYNYFIPKVRVNDRAVSLQESVLPGLYENRSAYRDMRWVADNDSALVSFWQQQGDTVLHILREYSGIEWQEPEFDIYLVRYFPSLGASDPLVIPVGGFGYSDLIEAAPEGSRQILNLVFQMSKRMLDQASQPEDSFSLSIAYHPLMRPGPFRKDNLAMLLALNTCQNIIGLDSTMDAYRSAFWKNRFPGREIFEKYFMDSWFLSPDQTLADWIALEPHNSQLVYVTRPPRKSGSDETSRPVSFVEGLPLKGQLGFSVQVGSGNQLVVTDVDVYRLAYACGLRADDVIRRVDGKVPRNQKTLVEYILAGLDEGGATVEILRDGHTEEVIIQPILGDFYMDEEYYPEYPVPVDSLIDSTEVIEDEF